METNPKVNRVFLSQPFPLKTLRVVIYCRVSSNSVEQLHSLTNQISFFTQEVYRRAC